MIHPFHQLECTDCESDCVVTGAAPKASGRDDWYVVEWTCTACREKYLVEHQLVVLVPLWVACERCGIQCVARERSRLCLTCDPDGEEDESVFRTTSFTCLEDAKERLGHGLFPTALAHVDRAIVLDPRSLDAWKLKAEILERIGLFEARRRMLIAAVEAGAPRELETLPTRYPEPPSNDRTPWWQFWKR